jgi:hypothetical protein
LTPLQAAQLSAKDIHKGHRWCVHHVRSGLEWSVSLSAGEAIEITDNYWSEAFNWSEIKEAVHA